MLLLTNCGTKLPVQEVGKQIIQAGRKKRGGHRYCDPVWIRQGGNQQEAGGEGRNSGEPDNCTCFFKTSFHLG